MTLKRYDAAQVTVFIAGLPIDPGGGYAEGEFLTIEQAEEDYTKQVGTDGQVTRSTTNNRSATAMLKLMQTSSGNTILSALRNTGLLARNGADVGPFMVRDRISGLCLYTAVECWIAKPPNVSLDKKATSREWQIDIAELVRVDAGS